MFGSKKMFANQKIVHPFEFVKMFTDLNLFLCIVKIFTKIENGH